MTSTDPDLDTIEARANAATAGPWNIELDYCDCSEYGCSHAPFAVGFGPFTSFENTTDRHHYDAEFVAAARTDVPALVAEIRRLRAAAAAELLPAWEAMYEPGNVSDYLIGYANDEHAAKGAAEAWLRSQKDEVGRLEWVPQRPLDGYDQEAELIERHGDGVDTGPGITVRRRCAVVPAAGGAGE
ncbi:hypothetical protein AB0M11_26420 [Streptomyces sp. NPDC051987]|uniref:hypothetical protein n=1 Tax=Streptomyces sp. NPDC051987 TaxID=3155808 RepID=UPI003430828E